MTDETVPPTMRVVITVRDREVTVEGDNLERLRNSTIHNIEKQLKRAARKAKRTVIRETHIMPDNKEEVQEGKIVVPDEEKKEIEEMKVPEKKLPSIMESLKALGTKTN